MAKYIAVWKKENGAPCFHLKPVEADNYQVLLDNAKENNITVFAIFDVTDESKEPEKVYSHPTQRLPDAEEPIACNCGDESQDDGMVPLGELPFAVKSRTRNRVLERKLKELHDLLEDHRKRYNGMSEQEYWKGRRDEAGWIADQIEKIFLDKE